MLPFLISVALSEPSLTRLFDQDASTVLSFRPNTIWLHPANLAFFEGTSHQISYTQSNLTNSFGYSSISGIFGFGVSYHFDDTTAWLNTATSLGIPLTSKFALGVTWATHNSVHDSIQQNTIQTFDMGLSFRPSNIIGLAAGMRNIGSMYTDIEPEYYSGLAVRAFSGSLSLGFDWTQKETQSKYVGTAIIRPSSGVELRAQSDIEGDWSLGLYLNTRAGYFGGSYTEDVQQFSFVRGTPIPTISMKKNRIASFSLSSEYPYTNRVELFSKPKETYLSLLHRIQQAALAQDIDGIFIRTDSLSLSYSQVREIGALLQEARNTGKKIIMYLNAEVNTQTYLLATYANRIVMHPAGDLSAIGLFVERLYLRGFFDLIGITTEVVRRSAYKSAPEQFTHTQSSPAAQEQYQQLYSFLFDHILTNISSNRSLDKEKARSFIDNGPYSAIVAKKNNYVDELCYPDELKSKIKTWFTKPEVIENYGMPLFSDDWNHFPEIAVLYASGAIVSGLTPAPGIFGRPDIVGSATLISQIEHVQENNNVRAVVLRIDSPGGSAFASEEIWRALMLLKQKKPLIISMGKYAASGGYYIATAGDMIFADPTTITGSIGVFATRFHLQNLYDLIGITTEQATFGAHAGIMNKSKDWSASERAKMEELIENTYVLFKTRVAEGRNLSAAEVESLAQGRVWSGFDAKTNKLVDELGGIHDAIFHAKLKAGIPPAQEIKLLSLSSENSFDLSLNSKIQIVQEKIKGKHNLQNDWEIVQKLQQHHIWMLMPSLSLD